MNVETNKNDVKSENERKKEYLRSYQNCSRRIKRIESEIDEIRSMKMYPSMQDDGMPHGSGQADLSGYAAELTKLEDELYKEGVDQVKLYKDITWKIQQLEDENERDVLFYRYIKGENWWRIAELTGYSERQIFRIHGDALKNLKITKDVSECQ